MMTEERLMKNLDKNRAWFWTAIEMLGLAVYLVWRNQYFEVPPPQRTILGLLDDPLPLMMLVAFATFTIVVSLWNIKHLHATLIRTVFVWFSLFVYFGAFFVRDWDLHRVSIETIYTGVLLLRVVHEALRHPELRAVQKELAAHKQGVV